MKLYPVNWMMNKYFTLNLFLPLALGGLIACLKKEKVVEFYKFFKPVYAFAGLIIYGILYYCLCFKTDHPVYKGLFEEYLFAAVSALFVATASIDGFNSISKLILENKFVNYIGKISYGLYVYHLFVIHFFWDIFIKEASIRIESKHTAWTFYFLICFSIAALSFHLIEKPIGSLKNKFNY
jgi:peptidoglycan/LPS O-acetylase OafA/YrhL